MLPCERPITTGGGRSTTAACGPPGCPLLRRPPSLILHGSQHAQRPSQCWTRQRCLTACCTKNAQPPAAATSTSDELEMMDDDSEAFSTPLASTLDAQKEFERRFRRAVFTQERWTAHRSTNRYLRHLSGILNSRTFRGLSQPLAYVLLMSVAASAYQEWLEPVGWPQVHFGDLPLNITSFALSLLLVFRTDSSYSRWQEALCTWNHVRNYSKDLVRLTCYWVRNKQKKAMLVRWTAAFSRALLVHVRADAVLEAELEGVLLPHEIAAVKAAGPHGAAFVLQVLLELIEQCEMTDLKDGKMLDTIRALGDTIGVCDKILRYPLPLAYTRHTSRFMMIWLAALPFALWNSLGWGVIPITVTIAYLLLGIDEIGVQIEEPFGILPIEDVCADIESEVFAIVDRQDVITDLLQASGIPCSARSSCDYNDDGLHAPPVGLTASEFAAAKRLAVQDGFLPQPTPSQR